MKPVVSVMAAYRGNRNPLGGGAKVARPARTIVA